MLRKTPAGTVIPVNGAVMTDAVSANRIVVA